MPKTYITQEQRQRARFSAWLYGAMKTSRITQAELAKRLGCSQQKVSKMLKYQKYTLEDLLVIFDVFRPDREELDTLLGIDRHNREY